MSHYWLKNVQIESGFDTVNRATKTQQIHIEIKDGKVSQIRDSFEAADDTVYDMKGLLILPSFLEKHCHLDKTLLGEPWRAVNPVDHIFERLDEEKAVYPSLQTSITDRAEISLEKYIRTGVTHLRTHLDVFPEIGTSHIEEIKALAEKYKDKVNIEIVAFPQQGLLRSDAKDTVLAALDKGASFVGGVDPATVDNDIEKSLQTTFELAVQKGAGIDLHLHDHGELGIYTIKRMAELTKEAGLENQVTVSHAFALGDIEKAAQIEMAEILKEAGMSIVTSVPIDTPMPPVSLLKQHGVNVAVGCDNIFDLWSPFGSGDILERVSRLAEVEKWLDEKVLADSLQYITDGRLSDSSDELDTPWLKVGDWANFTFADAVCRAEAVARRKARYMTIYQGNMTYNNLKGLT